MHKSRRTNGLALKVYGIRFWTLPAGKMQVEASRLYPRRGLDTDS